MFDSYIKENYKVVDYHVKTPPVRDYNLTWRPHGYHKKRKSRIACSKCIALWAAVIIEARSAMSKERKTRLEFDTDSFDILIDNCCSHTLTNDINDYIEPPVKSSVRVRSFNGSTNKPWWEQTSGKSKMTMVKCTTSYYQTHVIHLQLKPDYCHHNIGLRPGKRKRLILCNLP
jgi:hypothetical protein